MYFIIFFSIEITIIRVTDLIPNVSLFPLPYPFWSVRTLKFQRGKEREEEQELSFTETKPYCARCSTKFMSLRWYFACFIDFIDKEEARPLVLFSILCCHFTPLFCQNRGNWQNPFCQHLLSYLPGSLIFPQDYYCIYPLPCSPCVSNTCPHLY